MTKWIKLSIILSLFILIIPTSFAAVCPAGYTYTTIATPANGTNIYTDGVNSVYSSTTMQAFAHFKWYRTEVCYKSIAVQPVNIYNYTYNSGWGWGGYITFANPATAAYSFAAPLVAPKISSLTTTASYITQTNSGAIPVTLSGITDPDVQIITYSYQWNGTGSIWTNFPQTGTAPLLNATQMFTLSGTTLSEWNNTVYIRASDGLDVSNVLSVTLNKDTTPPVIGIKNPVAIVTSTKTVSAVVDDVNGAILKLNINTAGLCNDTLNFVDYTPITFSSEADNGKTICYKAVDPSGNKSFGSSQIMNIGVNNGTIESVVEYLFNNWSLLDTSGNNNFVQWANMTYGYDETGMIDYGSFNLGSQIGGLLGWWADTYGAYGISLWVKFDETTIPVTTSCAYILGTPAWQRDSYDSQKWCNS